MTTAPALPEDGIILAGLPYAIILVDGEDVVRYVNVAAEQFFRVGASHLCGRGLAEVLPADSPIFTLVTQVREAGHSISEYEITVDSPRTGPHFVNIQASPVTADHRDDRPGAEALGFVVLSLHEHSIARKIDRQLIHRGAARSISAIGSLLAHEVKNPLSGIRGAAQLLETAVEGRDRDLTRLIRDEVDRVCALVDRMGTFSGDGAPKRSAINIHEVLDYVRSIAEAGFARHVKFIESYDPSLPPVYGDRDQLVQVFLNLIKNAAEAVPAKGGEITLGTAFQHGVRMSLPGRDKRVQLPLVITVQDNGGGVPDDLVSHLFDPFVTTKSGGTGLGLALVAKVIDDHGGVVELDNFPRRTTFRVMLPMMLDVAPEADETV